MTDANNNPPADDDLASIQARLDELKAQERALEALARDLLDGIERQKATDAAKRGMAAMRRGRRGER